MRGGDRIELRDLRVMGHHGLLPEERTRMQPFSVDLEMTADLQPAGMADDLSLTIDYGAIAEAVAAEVAGFSTDLLEAIAERVASRVLALAAGRATSVTLTIRKLRPPVPVDLGSVAVTITRP